MPELQSLRRAAREVFDDALRGVDAGRAVRRAVSIDGRRLRVLDTEFDLRARPLRIYSVAVGKAAWSSASALEEILSDRIVGGVISAPPSSLSLPERWQVFSGGHPLPDDASLQAAQAASALLRKADHSSALIIFLVSGGGSAMMERPRDASVTLEDLREANRVLVTCGANIAEVNTVRRSLSAVKGGGLSMLAPRAAQLTLVVSDTNANRAADVASGPSIQTPESPADVAAVVARYDLAARLPPAVVHALGYVREVEKNVDEPCSLRRHYVVLDNESALEAAAQAARARGFVVETARTLVEQPVVEGAAELVARLAALHERENSSGRVVCLISGGEFACPVRGGGIGGRNAETALRCAFEMERLSHQTATGTRARHMLALCAGSDGIDGNSPAAGAVADQTTLRRARERGMDARRHLEESDAYTLFDTLGDAVVTGATGTNVRDVRILLAH